MPLHAFCTIERHVTQDSETIISLDLEDTFERSANSTHFDATFRQGKTQSPMMEKRVEVLDLQQQLLGRCFDVEYAVSAIDAMNGAGKSFGNTLEFFKNAIFLKQQLNYEEQRRHKKDGNRDSVYKSLSVHIPTLDHLPNEISDVVRGTANKV